MPVSGSSCSVVPRRLWSGQRIRISSVGCRSPTAIRQARRRLGLEKLESRFCFSASLTCSPMESLSTESVDQFWDSIEVLRHEQPTGYFAPPSHASYASAPALNFLAAYLTTLDDKFAQAAKVQLEYAHSRLNSDHLFPLIENRTPARATRDSLARYVYTMALAGHIFQDPKYVDWADDTAEAMLQHLRRDEVAMQSGNLYRVFYAAYDATSPYGVQSPLNVSNNQTAAIGLGFTLLHHEPRSRFYRSAEAAEVALGHLYSSLDSQPSEGVVPLGDAGTYPDTSYGAYTAFAWGVANRFWQDARIATAIDRAATWLESVGMHEERYNREGPQPLFVEGAFTRALVFWEAGKDPAPLIRYGYELLDDPEIAAIEITKLNRDTPFAFFHVAGVPRDVYYPRHGVFLDEHGSVVVLGTSDNDRIEVSLSEGLIQLNDTRCYVSNAKTIRVEAGDGDDLLKVSADGVDQLAVPISMDLRGGNGANRILVSTSGEDELVRLSPLALTIESESLQIEAGEWSRMDVDGGEGDDRLVLEDGPANDTVSIGQGWATISGGGFYGTGRGVTRVDTLALANDNDKDRLLLYAASPSKTAVIRSDFSSLSGGPFYATGRGFSRVDAFAEGDSGLRVVLKDTPHDDTFVIRSEIATVSGGGFYATARNFGRVDALSESGGEDRVAIYGSSERETVSLAANAVALHGASFHATASGCSRIDLYAGSEDDRLVMNETPRNDRFYVGQFTVVRDNEGEVAVATGFHQIDILAFIDSDHDTVMVAVPEGCVINSRPEDLLLSADTWLARIRGHIDVQFSSV